METKRNSVGALALTAALLASALAVLAFAPPVRVVDECGVRLDLPARVGEFAGVELRCCQRETCMQVFELTSLTNATICPACGAELRDRGLPETRLPADTVIVRRRYSAPDRPTFLVSVVLSSKDRTSIHKPEDCLVGQGHTIISQRVIDVPIKGRAAPLRAMLLDVARMADARQGQRAATPGWYAYWFTSASSETPYHVTRHVRSALDAVLHNTRERWAYVAVSAPFLPGMADQPEPLGEFIGQLYPLIAVSRPQ